jgi:hypothetical protein
MLNPQENLSLQLFSAASTSEYHWVSYASLIFLKRCGSKHFPPEADRIKYLGSNQGHQGGESPFPNVGWLMVESITTLNGACHLNFK